MNLYRKRLLPSVICLAAVLLLGTFGVRAEDNTTNIINAITNDLSGGTLTVGQNGSNNVLIVSQGGKVFDGAGIIGDGSNANNNTAWITDPDSVWSNSSSLNVAAGAPPTVYQYGIIGGGTVVSNGAAGGYGNALLVVNGGWVYALDASVGMGGAGGSGGNGGDGGSSNNVAFLGLGSLWANQGELSLGRGGDGGSGSYVTDFVLTNGFLQMITRYTSDGGRAGIGGQGNRLVVSNGAAISSISTSLGKAGASNGNGIGGVGGCDNSILISGIGTVFSNTASLTLGLGGLGCADTNGACGGNSNVLTVSSGGAGYSLAGNIDAEAPDNERWAREYSNSVAVSVGAGASGKNGGRGGDHNGVVLSGPGASWHSGADLLIGGGGYGVNYTDGIYAGGTNNDAYSGSGGADNFLAITNGGKFYSVNTGVGAGGNGGDYAEHMGANAIGGTGGDHNFLEISGTGSILSNSVDLNLGAGGRLGLTGQLTHGARGGAGGSGNRIMISDGGMVYCVHCNIGNSQDAPGGSSNCAFIVGLGARLQSSATITVGAGVSGANGLVVSNGGSVFSGAGTVELGSNNYVVVTGRGSVWSNSANFSMSSGGVSNLLLLTEGGLLRSSGGYLGGYGSMAAIAGQAAAWSNSGSFTFGGGGNVLSISNGGRMASTNCSIEGVNASSSGGHPGGIFSNVINIAGGGNTNAQALSPPVIYGGNTIRVMDPFSAWNIATSLTLGKGGDGTGGLGSANGSGGSCNNSIMLSGGAVMNSASCTLGLGGAGQIYHWQSGLTIYWSGGYGGNGGDSNIVAVAGAGSVWTNSGDVIVGAQGANDGSGQGGVHNGITVSNSGVIVIGGMVQLGTLDSGSNSQLSAVSGGQILVTNRLGSGTIDIQNGSLLVQGGVVTVNKLCATNGAVSVLQFPTGLLDVGSAMVADGVPFVVGDGISPATLHLRGGTSVFADGLIIASNAVLTGTGTIYGDVKVYGTKAATLNIIPGVGGSLNATDLTWHTGGDASWFRQTLTTHDGGAALRSGAIGAGQQTWFQTTTNGPGSLQFWWKVSAAAANSLQFYVNTQLVSQIAGNADWNQYVGFIAASNPVTLKWVYTKTSAAVSGSDAGFVDQVTWTPCPYAEHVPQMFYQDPSGTLASWVLGSTGGFQFARVLANTGGWALKAAGDIDGDGVSDLLFENAAGDTGGWFMNADGSVRDARFWFNIGVWEIRACADYEGTGRGQLFFQTPAGDVAFWRLDTNGVYQSSVPMGRMPAWKLRGAGDLDGDHKAELFWQNAAGQVAVWYHNPDGSIRGASAFSTGPWALCATADIDGDGVSELLWQTPGGDTGGWFMNSNSVPRSANFWWNTGAWKLRAAGR